MLAKNVPGFWGGSADLSSSNNTLIATEKDFEPGQYEGRNIWFGVREFGMAAAMNGIALHGGTRIYGATFFVFVDYLRPAIRLAALQKLPVTFVLTHDTVAVGEDGPTHEPIEQLSSLRGMPNLSVIRPADANEVVAAWKLAMETQDHPTILVLTRQNLPVLAGTAEKASTGVAKGGYVVSPEKGEKPDGILIATGSEVHLAQAEQEELRVKGKDVRVVSLPSFDLFEKQTEAYRESVLPKEVTRRVAIEMGSSFGWKQYVGDQGSIIGIDRFGESGKGDLIVESLGFTVEHLVQVYESIG